MTKSRIALLARALLFALLACSLAAPVPAAPVPAAPQTSYTAMLPAVVANSTARGAAGTAFGVDFITSAQSPSSDDRYLHAAMTEAQYDRVPFYWWAIETAENEFDWSAHDEVVVRDFAHGYKLDAILLLPPWFYVLGPCSLDASRLPRVGRRPAQFTPAGPGQDCTTPRNLDLPVFTDGSDVPGPGKSINPSNYWARYVNLAVARYMPGGVLAQQQGWNSTTGIRLWEIWNEPDWEWFWNGNAAQYARALKVATIAMRQADPEAQAMFGGLSNIGGGNPWPNGRPDWLHDVLAVTAADPNPALRDSLGWYFDSVGDHNYSDAWSSWNLIYQHNNVVSSFGLSGKGSWLTETGVPICEDYPGPQSCDPAYSPYRANLTESASFEIQSAAYGMFVGLDGFMHFQLYDECGNPYDAFGIFRNPPDYPCNNQSPFPNQARPSIDAFKVDVHYLWGLEPLWRKRPGGPDPYSGPQEWIAFYRPQTHERVLAVWARFYSAQTASIPATGSGALRVDQTGATAAVVPVNGYYTLTLPAATNLNQHYPDGSAMIGGRPYLIIETDTRAPSVSLAPLPPQSPPQIALSWSGEDLGSGIGNYQVFASVDNGPLALWLATRSSSATYSGQSGHSYGFAVRAVDAAGNWLAVPTSAQASTYVP